MQFSSVSSFLNVMKFKYLPFKIGEGLGNISDCIIFRSKGSQYLWQGPSFLPPSLTNLLCQKSSNSSQLQPDLHKNGHYICLSWLSWTILAYPVLSCPILASPGLSQPILTFSGLSWAICAYSGLSSPILVYSGLSWPILTYSGSSWDILPILTIRLNGYILWTLSYLQTYCIVRKLDRVSNETMICSLGYQIPMSLYNIYH